MSRRTAAPPIRPALVSGLAALALLLGGCSGADDDPAADAAPAGSPTQSPEAGAADGSDDARLPRASAPPRPQAGTCHRITYRQALAPVARGAGVPCRRDHTSRTFAVADLPVLIDGHLLAVDSARARRAPARACPARLGRFLGGGQDARRLSMFEAVWFSPSLQEYDAGASWFRCDVVLLAADRRLGLLAGKIQGILDRPGGDRYGMCGTAKPGTAAFERVACARKHRWRAVRVIPLLPLAGEQGRYPGVDAVRAEGQAPCEDTGQARAADPLTFQWGYEWPTAQRWKRGTTYGICWVPDES